MNVFEVIVVGVLALTGLTNLALVLRFLWLVYDRGGRADLTAAARALRQVHGLVHGPSDAAAIGAPASSPSARRNG